MGHGVSKTHPNAMPIPISIGSSKPRVWLYVIHTYDLDDEGAWLMMLSSTISIYTSPEMNDDELVLALDYIREPANQYPGCHLHVSGVRSDLDSIYLGSDRKSRKLRDLHLPVGGKRYRPTLEDVIEFMITEEMVSPRSGWDSVLGQHRAVWFQRQLAAAVRRSPEIAADALRREGWRVDSPPESG